MRSLVRWVMLFMLVFIGFVVFTYLVSKEYFLALDFNSLVKLQDAVSLRWNTLWLVGSWLGSMEVMSLVIVLSSWLKWGWKRTVVVVGMYGLGLGIGYWVRLYLHHPSPAYMFYRGDGEFGFSDYYVHSGFSYPSGHAYRAAFMVGLLIVGLTWKRWRLSMYVSICGLSLLGWISVSKLLLGHHWLSDILGGWGLGLSMVMGVMMVWTLLVTLRGLWNSVS